MKKIIIKTSDGKEYPARLTMGAMLQFKRETGKEVDEAQGVSDMITLMWCCTKSACAADGVEFGYGLQEFADRMSASAVDEFTDAVNDGSQTYAKKK